MYDDYGDDDYYDYEDYEDYEYDDRARRDAAAQPDARTGLELTTKPTPPTPPQAPHVEAKPLVNVSFGEPSK